MTLYANNCGEACDGGRALLTKRGILFTERNPETDKAGYDALMKLTGGQQTVPVLSVGSKVLKGFSEGEWQEALTAAGFTPRVFAYPFGARTSTIDRAVLAHVALVRSVAYPTDGVQIGRAHV